MCGTSSVRIGGGGGSRTPGEHLGRTSWHRHFNKKQKDNTKEIRKLQSKIDKSIPTKPKIKNLNAELNSICAKYDASINEFDGFICLSSLGKKYGKINIPVKLTTRSNYWSKKGKMMKSFL